MEERRSFTGASPAARLAALQESLRDCRGCGLSAGRTQVVFGAGDPEARLMFVGEGPGFHEDRQGEPFVGQAGKLLTSLLERIGLRRSDVYIANVVKCRPPENRDPSPDEIEACSPHLMEQIGIIRPQVVCTLGRFAAKLLTGTELSMTAIHGKAKPMSLSGVSWWCSRCSIQQRPFTRRQSDRAGGGLRQAAISPGKRAPSASSTGGAVSDEAPQAAVGARAAQEQIAVESYRPPQSEQLHLW
jgi:uracil-DNA glycosylase family 4